MPITASALPSTFWLLRPHTRVCLMLSLPGWGASSSAWQKRTVCGGKHDHSGPGPQCKQECV
eukprot:4561563-Amphidinium_carterae.1